MTYIQRANDTTFSLLRAERPTEARRQSSVSHWVDRGYTEIEAELAAEDRTFWCHMAPQERPVFTPAMLRDLDRVQGAIEGLARRAPDGEAAIRWVVFTSRKPGVFNLGGDLALFSEHIRTGKRESLRRYAHSCVEIVFRNWNGYRGDVVTVGLAQGEALGGGFEALLSFDVIIAEKRARFGLPEILFNLFPGMGAQSLLMRRLGATRANEIILSGKVFTAEQMHALGIVDIVVEDGEGVEAARQYIQRNAARHNAHAAIYKARRRVNPVTLDELRDIADIWVDAAFRLREQDLRRMTHLAVAQERRRAASVPVAATN